MIKAHLLNSDATLNSWFVIESITYVPGEDVKIVLQLMSTQLDIRYIAPIEAVLTATLTDSDGADLTKTPTIAFADDRSIWTFNLSQAETENLGSPNIVLSLDVNGDGTLIYKTQLSNVLIRSVIGECC